MFGCEIDPDAHGVFTAAWRSRGFADPPSSLERHDFFTWLPPGSDRSTSTHRRRYFTSRLEQFDLVIGNPPFGGSINPELQDDLDALFGIRGGRKIKKETYAFFIVKCLDLLKPGGRLVFICSDTLLTIPTMAGLRAWLQSMCDIQVAEVPGSFEDTNQNMILLTLTKQYEASQLTMFGTPVPLADVEATPNMSWRIDRNLARYFGGGVTLGDKMVATSGTTIGNNDLLGLVTTRVLRAVTEPPLHISTVSGTSPSE